MFPYWFLFGLFALSALMERVRSSGYNQTGPLLGALSLVMTLMIGLRFEVGADFAAYAAILERATGIPLADALEQGDPGYQFVNWVVGQLGGDLWLVNLVCAAIFCWGLVRLCRNEPVPTLAGLIAIPYLVVVVAMGYTRQAVAIGFIMAGIASISHNPSILKFAGYVAAAALFHRTAVIVLPLAIFAGRRNRVMNFVAVAAVAYGLYSALLDESVDAFVTNYIETHYASQGALIRVAMNLLPAGLILLQGRQMSFSEHELRLWKMFAIVSVAMIPLFFVIPSTTAIDRIALYMLPIQIVGLGRSVLLFRSQAAGRLVIVGYCATVLFVWLNFAAHAFAWIPYRLTPIWS